jgi:hypothetical protein
MCALVAGTETGVDIDYYGCLKYAWLTSFLNLPYGTSSHDTFRRIFSLVDPLALEQCFRQWMVTTASPLPREVVAVDDKTVRRSFDCGRAQAPLHVVSTFATQQIL